MMKLIKNMVITKIDSGYLMINSLNGLVDIVNESTLEIVKKWHDMDHIETVNEIEQELFGALTARGYMCFSEDEEKEQKDKIILALRERYNKIQARTSSLTFVMTYNCNFRCPYCFEAANDNPNEAYINEEHIDAALEIAGKDLVHIGLFGGEPLLPKNRKSIEYLISKAPDKKYSIITNGYYLDRYIDLFSNIDISYVMVTLDGGKATHDRRRVLANGEPTFDIISKNIQNCLEHNIPIRIRMNIDRENLNESIELKNLLVSSLKGTANNLSFEISPLMDIRLDERNRLFQSLFNNERTTDQCRFHNEFLSRTSPIINSLINGEKLRPIYSFCDAHESGLIVDPQGLIFPCLVSVGKRPLAIGTYYPEVRYFNNSIRNRNIETIEKCHDCSLSLLCGGGCPVKLDSYVDIHRPECSSIVNDIYNLLPLLLKTKEQ